jgi:signal transduction histidine kinase
MVRHKAGPYSGGEWFGGRMVRPEAGPCTGEVKRKPVRALRLQHRIVIPFVVVAVIATAAATIVTLRVSSDALRSRLEAQLVSAIGVVSRGDLALNRVVLQNVHDITGAHVLTFWPGQQLAVSTLEPQGSQVVATVARLLATAPDDADRGAAVATWTDCGGPCLVVRTTLPTRPGYRVVLVAETSDLSSANRAVARAVLLAAALSVLVMVLVSQAVVRRVTAPLERLVAFVRSLSPEDTSRRAPVGDDEVGTLADAFNGMLDRLRQSQSALVRSEKLALAGMFAARVAHDIRNPLSSIKMQTQLLRSRVDDQDDRATIGAVLHDIEQVESVIRDLLELARPGDLRLETESLNAVVRDAVNQLAPQFAHRRIVVDLRLGNEVPPLPLDRNRLKQALLNVMVNASEAMPTGGSITIATRVNPEGLAEVEVSDDGVGLNPDVGERVFEPFVSTKPDGVGLGLVNVRSVVEGHGGRIRLVPRQPKGTTALVTFPLASRATRAVIDNANAHHG